MIRKYAVTSAEVHDSQFFEALVEEYNSNVDVWADAAYRNVGREAELKQARYRSHSHHMRMRARPLNARGQEANRKRSSVKAQVEHVFVQQTNRLIAYHWSGASGGKD